jgi:hypothetical protein
MMCRRTRESFPCATTLSTHISLNCYCEKFILILKKIISRTVVVLYAFIFLSAHCNFFFNILLKILHPFIYLLLSVGAISSNLILKI